MELFWIFAYHNPGDNEGFWINIAEPSCNRQPGASKSIIMRLLPEQHCTCLRKHRANVRMRICMIMYNSEVAPLKIFSQYGADYQNNASFTNYRVETILTGERAFYLSVWFFPCPTANCPIQKLQLSTICLITFSLLQYLFFEFYTFCWSENFLPCKLHILKDKSLTH